MEMEVAKDHVSRKKARVILGVDMAELEGAAEEEPHGLLSNIVVSDQILARREARKRLDAYIAELAGELEEPHEFFSDKKNHDLVLDLIFSSLDGKSQLTARRVCKKWNERILANFHKKLALRFKGEDDPEVVRERLLDVDPRILSSLKFQDDRDNFEALQGLNKAFRTAMDFLFSKENEESTEEGGIEEMKEEGEKVCLRSLHYKRMDMDNDALNCLIKTANEGFPANLEDLVLEETECYLMKTKKPINMSILLPNALPLLKFLCLEPMPYYANPENNKTWMTMNVFEASGYLETFRSFLTSAPNLRHLKTNLVFDLSGLKNLKILNTNSNYLRLPFSMKEGVTSIKSASRGLRSLNMGGGFYSYPYHFHLNKFPTFPDLSDLVCCLGPSVGQRVDWSRFPKLKKLMLNEFNWRFQKEDLDNLLPLPDNLKEIGFTFFGHFLARTLCPEMIDSLVNLSVPRLVVNLSSWDNNKISKLFNILRQTDLEVKEPSDEKGPPRVLEFHLGKIVELSDDEPIEDFSAIMEKLSRNWDVVRFESYNKYTGQLQWTEVQLTGDKKNIEFLEFFRKLNLYF